MVPVLPYRIRNTVLVVPKQQFQRLFSFAEDREDFDHPSWQFPFKERGERRGSLTPQAVAANRPLFTFHSTRKPVQKAEFCTGFLRKE